MNDCTKMDLQAGGWADGRMGTPHHTPFSTCSDSALCQEAFSAEYLEKENNSYLGVKPKKKEEFFFSLLDLFPPKRDMERINLSNFPITRKAKQKSLMPFAAKRGKKASR